MILRRLIRRFRWTLIYQWRSLSLKAWPYESCQRCGKSFRVCWNVQDQYWHIVVGVSDDGGGSLCVDCFLELAEYFKVDIPIDAIKIEVFQPNPM